MPRSKKTSSRITVMDVARDAEVSRATVSLVLRNSPLVAESTRQRVNASIRGLGYVYHRGAASLRSQRTGTVGLIITDLANPFFAEVAAGIEAQLDAANVVALLCSTTDTLAKQDRFIATMQEHGVDGILLCPARGTAQEQVAHLAKLMPTVLMVREVGELAVDYVGADYAAGAEMAVKHLLDHGHTRIAMVGGPLESSARRERLRGYAAALTQAGIAVDDPLLVPTSVTRVGGQAAIADLLALAQPPTAALCYNDVVAYGVMLGLRAAGVVPGQEFAVVGCDDISEAALWQPALTTVAIHPRQIGEMAAQRLLDRMADRNAAAQRIILPTELMTRESCGCARKSSSTSPDAGRVLGR